MERRGSLSIGEPGYAVEAYCGVSTGCRRPLEKDYRFA